MAICRLCLERLAPKNRRTIFGETFGVLKELIDVLGYTPTREDGMSIYCCTNCFNKLTKLWKYEYDIKHRIDALKNDKYRLLIELRVRYYNCVKNKTGIDIVAPVENSVPTEEMEPPVKCRKKIMKIVSPVPVPRNLSEPAEIKQMNSVISKLEKIIELREKQQADKLESPMDSPDIADDHSTLTNLDFREILNADQAENCEVDEFNDIGIMGETGDALLSKHGPGIARLENQNIRPFLSDQPLLVYRQQLLMLASLLSISNKCAATNCRRKVNISTEVIGSAFHITWVCLKGHIVYRWCSQPIVKNTVCSGDVMMAAATVMSGNNYQKISNFAKCMNIPIPSISSFHEIQKKNIAPAIYRHWLQHQKKILERFQGREIAVLGHGRNLSPGHSTRLCSYSLMEMTTRLILCVVTFDRSVTDKSCKDLEQLCFETGMNILSKYKIKVVEVITDDNPQIADLMMRPKYTSIQHSFDIWQGMKNLCRTIIEAAQDKTQDYGPLLKWIRHITYHFWHCALVSRSCEEFKTNWLCLLHHVVNEHEWLLSYDDNFSHNKCRHLAEDEETTRQQSCVGNNNENEDHQSPGTDDKQNKYLEKGSDALNTLRKIVMDEILFNNIPYYLNCRSISDLKKFQNMITAYASTHHTYSPQVYHIRHILAALNHNEHLDRQSTATSCETGLQTSSSKNTASSILKEAKTKKEYQYVHDMLHNIISVYQ